MIKHIVIYTLKEQVNIECKARNTLRIKKRLESLQAIIRGIIRIEVGIDISKTQNSGDIVLNSEFDSQKSFLNYQNHPIYIEICKSVEEVICQQKSIIYEI